MVPDVTVKVENPDFFRARKEYDRFYQNSSRYELIIPDTGKAKHE